MSVFTVLFSVVVFLLAGLLVDGGSAINARLRANDIAEQAARAGADQIDVDHLRDTGEVRMQGQAEVCARAEEVVAAHGADGITPADCTVEQGQTLVTVAVRVRWTAFFLAAIGFAARRWRASEAAPEASAAPEDG